MVPVGRARNGPEDAGPLLDAWHASFSSNAVAVALMKKRAGGTELVQEMVFKDDDRRQVADTHPFPWQSICSLVITAADGSKWVGSGWLASPRMVVTAGHCVYLHGHGGCTAKSKSTPAVTAVTSR